MNVLEVIMGVTVDTEVILASGDAPVVMSANIVVGCMAFVTTQWDHHVLGG